MNIFGLYISYNQSERKYFEKILDKILKNYNDNRILLIHFTFHNNDKVAHIRTLTKKIPCEVIMIKDGVYIRSNTYIHKIKDIINLYKMLSHTPESPNVFIYSGHSDGLILGHKRIYFISMDDFSEIVLGALGKKSDLIWCDSCLSGNISSLNSLKETTRYFIASPMYYNFDPSVLETKNLYQFAKQKGSNKNKIISYGKKIINEYMRIQKENFNSRDFMVNIVFYEMNQYVPKLVDLVLKHKDQFEFNHCGMSKSKYYYMDILCSMKHLDTKLYQKTKKYLDQIICYKKQYDLGENLDSKLLIILREPYLYWNYDNDLFFKSNYVD
jgi:hypothetical protein